jgi:hypothetical protein
VAVAASARDAVGSSPDGSTITVRRRDGEKKDSSTSMQSAAVTAFTPAR